MHATRWTDERGSALPLVAIALVGVVLATTLIVAQTSYRVRLAQAQWAADASAKAAAAHVVAGSDGGGAPARTAASDLAEANGGRLVSVRIIDPDPGLPLRGGSSQPGIDDSTPISPTAIVEVEVDGVRARAAAARFAVTEP